MTPQELNISDDEIKQIGEALENNGIPDPIGRTITEQLGKVSDYTARFLLTADRINRLTRNLVLYELYKLLKNVPDAVQSSYDSTMKELEAIRDGKFLDLPLAVTPPVNTAAQGKYGSTTRVKTSLTGLNG